MKTNVEILAEEQFEVSPLGSTKEVIKQSIEYSINSIEDKGNYMVSVYVALTAMDKVREQMQGRVDEMKQHIEMLEDKLTKTDNAYSEARQEVERLKPYLRHFNGCDATHPFVLGKCTCGFDKEGQGE